MSFLIIKNPGKGTYILTLFLGTSEEIQIGKFGLFKFPPGNYAYVGSAFGSGGLSARLNHHLGPVNNSHWHIDYFRKKAIVTGIRVDQRGAKLEHQWAVALEEMPESSLPAHGFGATDCKCQSYLFCFEKEPDLDGFGYDMRVVSGNGGNI